ncbi:DUF5719 family protein [Arthrobacter sp. H5]|uniref:DUF5719 family protein n=1 Tax=Arthrobacter sp. H5 TaxID=1267973 RepID=UPI0004AFAF33|nr:DUF5719 family protein [Arthrobacter sp. H5]
MTELPGNTENTDHQDHPHKADDGGTSGKRQRQGSGGRRAHWARGVAGVATGVVLLGGAGSMVAWSIVAVPGGAAIQLPVPTAAVPPGEFSAVCAAPPRLLDGEVDGVDPNFSPVSETAESSIGAMVLSDLGGALPGSSLSPLAGGESLVTIAGDTAESGDSAAPEVSNEDGLTNRTAGVVRGQQIEGPTVLRAQAVGGQQATAGASLTYAATDGDLRGLASANCQSPGSDFWVLGASTTVGSTAVLNLHNPSLTPATVNLDLHGADGPIEAPGGQGILLPPGESQSIVLAGFAANQEQLAVRVLSDGGSITGVIQQSVLRGLTPGGVELIQPGAAASSTQFVSGIQVQDQDTAQAIQEQDGYASASPSLQVVVPGGTDAVLDIRLYGPDGEVELPGGGVVTAVAGGIASIPLDSLPAGNYAAAISSDVLVAAAAKVSRGSEPEEPVDLAVAPSTGRLGSEHVAVLPENVDSSFVFSAPSGRSEVQLTPVAGDGTLGEAKVFSIAGGTAVSVPSADLGDGVVSVLIAATGDPAYGAQVQSLDGDTPGISITPIAPGSAGQQSVAVNLGY